MDNQDDTKQNPAADQPEETQTQPEGQSTDNSVSEPEDRQPENSDSSEQTSTESDQTSTEEPSNEAENIESPDVSGSETTDQTDTVEPTEEAGTTDAFDTPSDKPDVPGARWYVVHTYSGHENRVATALKQRVESEHLESKIVDVLVPTQQKIEIRSGKKETIKEKIFPGYILVKMLLDDDSWLAVRTTQGVTSFVGMGNKPTPISESEVKSIVNFMEEGGQPTYKQIFSEGDTVKIIDGPFTEFIGKIDDVDKEKGKVRVLVSIFGRETPVELDFLQIAKL